MKSTRYKCTAGEFAIEVKDLKPERLLEIHL